MNHVRKCKNYDQEFHPANYKNDVLPLTQALLIQIFIHFLLLLLFKYMINHD